MADDRQPMLHRLGELGATIGSKAPCNRWLKLAVQAGLSLLIFGFLVFTVVSQWSELQEKGVEFEFIWVLPAAATMLVFYVLSGMTWGLTMRFMGHHLSFGQAQRVWGQPLLVRYVPGSVLFVLARVLLAERTGAPRRLTLACIAYEQAIQIVAALALASYFLIDHSDLSGNPLRWGTLVLIPVFIALLHPRIFGPVANRIFSALGRDPLPTTMSFPAVLLLLVIYAALWALMGLGVFFASRAVHYLPADEILTVASAQLIGYLAAVVSMVTPAGLGVRDLAFAWAVKEALPSSEFAVGAALAIAVRAVQTAVEVVYVGTLTLVTRKIEHEPGPEELLRKEAATG